MSCPNCGNLKEKFGFVLESNAYYMTMIPEVKNCCPVKVYVTEHNSRNVTMICDIDKKEYTKSVHDFYRSSWRLYDSF